MAITKVLMFFIAILLFSSCTTEWKAKVESDTSWSGSFAGTTVEGSGSKTIDLGSGQDEIYCCVVQKQTESGYLKVSIKSESNSIFGSEDGESKETTASYGVVSVCNK